MFSLVHIWYHLSGFSQTSITWLTDPDYRSAKLEPHMSSHYTRLLRELKGKERAGLEEFLAYEQANLDKQLIELDLPTTRDPKQLELMDARWGLPPHLGFRQTLI
jgi:hypothetical protein